MQSTHRHGISKTRAGNPLLPVRARSSSRNPRRKGRESRVSATKLPARLAPASRRRISRCSSRVVQTSSLGCSRSVSRFEEATPASAEGHFRAPLRRRLRRGRKWKNGRGGEIRTHDLYVPNVALYQAKLRPDDRNEQVTKRHVVLVRKQKIRSFRTRIRDGNCAGCDGKQAAKSPGFLGRGWKIESVAWRAQRAGTTAGGGGILVIELSAALLAIIAVIRWISSSALRRSTFVSSTALMRSRYSRLA